MASTAGLQKAAFIQRVRRRSARYGVGFDQGQLDEWIKQGLAIPADRRENRGVRPIYTYGHRHYRRALQLVRLYAANVRDRDAVLVQLFLSGYSVRPHEIREELKKEFLKAIAKLNAPVRSVYFDREGPIPPGRFEQSLGQLGVADRRLTKADLVPTNDLLIRAVRAGRNPNSENCELVKANDVGADFGELAFALAQPVLAGMLYADNEYASESENLIMQADESQYELARILFLLFRCLCKPANVQGDHASAFEAIYRSLNQREFSALILTMALRFINNERALFAPVIK
jgi:hypothetical protein